MAGASSERWIKYIGEDGPSVVKKLKRDGYNAHIMDEPLGDLRGNHQQWIDVYVNKKDNKVEQIVEMVMR
ncbi:unnamed protein product [Didymodactylos carnosus]|uniref:Uncharacterized protein n=1 Tax=Didymodactylos carnosus TaxID=1234261 RepID=A0A815N390_9BILA|nr:unnamed protein product [Didymodactylos carnosus]CAF1427881.1 unnamed protein product [Didymodactylos carnosus]CAF3761843.1 unnamed protein product [Didymodactylos carnosus]CAF4307691.1 unnamed protein product [Didymodactylos carnosus]